MALAFWAACSGSMTGIIKTKIPAKAKIIMTARITRYRKRIMSILDDHPGLNRRLARSTAANVLVSGAWAKTRQFRTVQDRTGCGVL